MSSEIFYDRAYILVGDRFIPVANHGSSNCYEFHKGREVPERNWSILNYPNHGKMLFTAEEMQETAEVYEQISMDNRGGTRKSRNRSFDEGEFRCWVLGGMKSAHTVEEYRSFGNTVVVVDYTDNYRKHPVATTNELLEKLEELAEHSISVAFDDNRKIIRPPMRKASQAHSQNKPTEYYVLHAEEGYYVKRSSRHIWFASHGGSLNPRVRKFRTLKAAQKFLVDNRNIFSKLTFQIERVQEVGAGT